MAEEQLTNEEKDALKEYLGFGPPVPEEKHNVHSFLNKVATATDTTKIGNLDKEELGLPRINLRTLKEASLIARDIIDNDVLADYYLAKSEILTSTSLSKNAKLINLAVIQKREVEDKTIERKENKGWFKKKDNENQQEGGN